MTLTTKPQAGVLGDETRDKLKNLLYRWENNNDYSLEMFCADFSATLTPSGAGQPEPAVTPSSRWRESGEPDPHAGHYDGERAALTLGDFTDEELANGAFMNYDVKLSFDDLLNPKPGIYPPIVWMTAVKDRIRWLSRALETALAAPQAGASQQAAPSEGQVSLPRRLVQELAKLLGPEQHERRDRLYTALASQQAAPEVRTDGAPSEIWLQLHGDGVPDGQPVDYTDEVSWCWHKVNDHDVRYVLAAAPQAAPVDPAGVHVEAAPLVDQVCRPTKDQA